ncbi:hypothetical protein CHUAL_008510 [Chamberlinius hualienensis]
MSMTDNHLYHWDFDDQLKVKSNETELTNNNYKYNLIKWQKNGHYLGTINQNNFNETTNYSDEEAEKKVCDTKPNGRIIKGFDAPYVSRLYQLCYDTESECDDDDEVKINGNEQQTARVHNEEMPAQQNTDDEHNTSPDSSVSDAAKLSMQHAVEERHNNVKTNEKCTLQSDINSDRFFLNGDVSLQNNEEMISFSEKLNGTVATPTSNDQQHTGSHMNGSCDEQCVNPTNDDSIGFITKQAELQAEARIAMEQAKQMAKMQMEIEKQVKKKSSISEFIGIPLPVGKHKLNKYQLVEMNLAQLQVIVNDVHTHIESLNEELVKLLLEREELHVDQDSMLVRVEQLTRYN